MSSTNTVPQGEEHSLQCKVCMCGVLPECPGRRVTAEEKAKILDDLLDYFGGKWHEIGILIIGPWPGSGK